MPISNAWSGTNEGLVVAVVKRVLDSGEVESTIAVVKAIFCVNLVENEYLNMGLGLGCVDYFQPTNIPIFRMEQLAEFV